jgi:hypothetical protein
MQIQVGKSACEPSAIEKWITIIFWLAIVAFALDIVATMFGIKSVPGDTPLERIQNDWGSAVEKSETERAQRRAERHKQEAQ